MSAFVTEQEVDPILDNNARLQAEGAQEETDLKAVF